MKFFASFLFVVLLAPDSLAQDPSPQSYSMYIDEDFLQHFGEITDENYTMGFGIRIQHGELGTNGFATSLLKTRDKIGKWFNKNYAPLSGDSAIRSRNQSLSGYISFAGSGFTPTNLNTSQIQYDDRPYASIVSLTYGVGRLIMPEDDSGHRPRFDQTEVSFGLLGTGVSSQFQTLIHQSMNNNDTENPHTPKGWKNQISDGGEPTFLITLRTTKLLYSIGMHAEGDAGPKKFLRNKAWENNGKSFKSALRFFDLAFSKEINYGYYSGIGSGFAGRLGLLDFRSWTTTNNPLGKVSLMDSKQDAMHDEVRKYTRNFELYISSEIKGYLMPYNALLQGQFRKSDYTIDASNVNPFFYTWSNGLTLNTPLPPFKNTYLNVTYNFYTYRSPEFRRANYYGKAHVWGGVYFTLTHFI